jgi:hypothetical protein
MELKKSPPEGRGRLLEKDFEVFSSGDVGSFHQPAVLVLVPIASINFLQSLCFAHRSNPNLCPTASQAVVDITESNEYWSHPPDSAEFWPAAGATDISGQRAVLPARADCEKERVIVPGPGVGTAWSRFLVSTHRLPILPRSA